MSDPIQDAVPSPPAPGPAEERQEGKKSVFSKRWRWNKAAPLRTLYNFLLRLVRPLVMRFRIDNANLMPASGPVIVIMNHVHWMDPLLPLSEFGRPVTPMAKVEAFENPFMRLLVEPYGTIPVHRGELDMQAMKGALEVLKGGGVIIISPEGTRSRTGALIQAQEGFAFLATRSNATIVPAAITGSTDVGRKLKRLSRADVVITLGPPFQLDASAAANGRPNRRELQRLTDDAMFRLAALLPESMRGHYAGSPRALAAR